MPYEKLSRYIATAPRWPEVELRQGTPEVISNHREVIKTRGESYNGKNVPVFRIVASLDPCKLFVN